MLSSNAVRRHLAVAALALATAGAGGCGNSTQADDRTSVVTALYPLQFVAERIGGDNVTVSNLTRPGAEPHDLELTAQQVVSVKDAKLVAYLKGFQPQVDDAVAQEAADHAFDAASAVPLLDAAPGAGEHADEDHADEEPADAGKSHTEATGTKDPHVWLDPTRLATIADRFADRLAQADPAHAAEYRTRTTTLRADLATLDQEFAAKLQNCQRREIITSHSAFNYLATRYGLTQVGITGLSPEAEPTAQRLQAVAAEAREHHATTIFFETLVSPKVAETIAREVGAKTAVLDPLEGLTEPGTDYLSVMRANLRTLATTLECR